MVQTRMSIPLFIPQLFYDIIARMVPGAVLLILMSMLIYGPLEGLLVATTWSKVDSARANVSGWIVFPCNVLASYVTGALLGGLWFRWLYPLRWKGDGNSIPAFLGFAGDGDQRIETFFWTTFGGENVWYGPQLLSKMSLTERIAFMYDYLSVYHPTSAARLAKLRAEQHMAGVFVIGLGLLLAVILVFPSTFPWAAQNRALVVIGLLLGIAAATSLARHVGGRCANGLYFLWLLSIAEKGIVFQTNVHRPLEIRDADVRTEAYASWQREGCPTRSPSEQESDYYAAQNRLKQRNGFVITCSPPVQSNGAFRSNGNGEATR